MPATQQSAYLEMEAEAAYPLRLLLRPYPPAFRAAMAEFVRVHRLQSSAVMALTADRDWVLVEAAAFELPALAERATSATHSPQPRARPAGVGGLVVPAGTAQVASGRTDAAAHCPELAAGIGGNMEALRVRPWLTPS